MFILHIFAVQSQETQPLTQYAKRRQCDFEFDQWFMINIGTILPVRAVMSKKIFRKLALQMILRYYTN